MNISPIFNNMIIPDVKVNTPTEWVTPVINTGSFPPQVPASDTVSKNKNSKKTTYIATGTAGLILLAIAFIKRKSISKFLKNIFKKGGSSSSSSAGQTAQQARAKIVLPKPNFTVGKENPEQFAKEKAEYINSIWDEFLDIRPPFKPMDKEKSILGLKALQQFGTREDLLKLHPRYQLSKDSDIMKEYAKLANKVGESIDCLPLMSKLGTKDIAYEESTLAEIMKALKTLMVDRTEPNTWLNFSYQSYRDFERLATHPNKVISENAKAIMKRISDENKWMLE